MNWNQLTKMDECGKIAVYTEDRLPEWELCLYTGVSVEIVDELPPARYYKSGGRVAELGNGISTTDGGSLTDETRLVPEGALWSYRKRDNFEARNCFEKVVLYVKSDSIAASHNIYKRPETELESRLKTEYEIIIQKIESSGRFNAMNYEVDNLACKRLRAKGLIYYDGYYWKKGRQATV